MLTLNNFQALRAGGVCPVFSPVTLEISPGEMIVVTGENGAGKTSLLRALAGLCPFQGTATSSSLLPSLFMPAALQFQAFPQTASQGSLSVQAWMSWQRYILRPEWRQSYDKAANPHMQSILHKELCTLSSGWRKRVELLRLDMQKADVWLLDEPTEFLDQQAVALLLHRVALHMKQRGLVIVATHHEALFRTLATYRLHLTSPPEESDGEGCA